MKGFCRTVRRGSQDRTRTRMHILFGSILFTSTSISISFVSLTHGTAARTCTNMHEHTIPKKDSKSSQLSSWRPYFLLFSVSYCKQIMSASNKVCAIFGFGPGIGAAVARKWSKEGYQVAIMSRSLEKVKVCILGVSRRIVCLTCTFAHMKTVCSLSNTRFFFSVNTK